MTDVVQNSNSNPESSARNEFENAAHNLGDNDQEYKSGAGGRAVNEVFANLRDQNEESVPSTWKIYLVILISKIILWWVKVHLKQNHILVIIKTFLKSNK